jgi:hypothetical protein
MSEPPVKKPLAKLPPKTVVSAQTGRVKRDKITQTADPNRVYTLNTGAKTRGKKIIIYGASGMGKTTVACTAPDPVFVAADDGIDIVTHPVTNEDVPSYKAPTYQDVRNILGQPKLFEGFKTVVLDTMTEVENMAVPFILETVTRDGHAVKNLEGYGWGSGYGYLAEHDNYVKNDLQRLCDLGFNVIVICQMAPRKETSAEVDEYLKDGPKLVWRPGSKAYAVTDFVEWSDYCLKIGYSSMTVAKKRASSSGERVIFTQPETHFEAKFRERGMKASAVSFSAPEDDSIWRFVFNQAWKDMPVGEEQVNG